MVSGGRPHGTTQEAGYDVGQSGGRPHGTHNIILNLKSNVEQHFFLLSMWSFLHTKQKFEVICLQPWEVLNTKLYICMQNGQKLAIWPKGILFFTFR